MFRGTWVWYLVIAIAVLTLVGLSVTVFTAEEQQDALISLVISTIALSGVVVFFASAKLTITIDQGALYYRYPPFVRKEKVVQKEDVSEIFVRKYRPIREYGGYGYRYSLRAGRALNISGNMGLQLVLTNGKKLLIGTQSPELLEHAVKRLKENWNMNG